MGIVQGLAEYLPISSSGHLEIMKQVLGLDMSGADSLEFDIVLHVATVLSTIVVLWRSFVPLLSSFFGWKKDDNFYYVWKIMLSCVPILLVYVLFKKKLDMLFEGDLMVVGICLLVTAALLTFAFMFRTEPAEKLHRAGVPVPSGHEVTWIDALLIGVAQSVAVLPGLSRSGSTIATGLVLGVRRDKLAQFSFFMVIIPILGKALLDLKDLLFPSQEKLAEIAATAGTTQAPGAVAVIVGFLAAFIVGCAACRWMIKLVNNGKLIWFALYCSLAGITCIVWQMTQ